MSHTDGRCLSLTVTLTSLNCCWTTTHKHNRIFCSDSGIVEVVTDRPGPNPSVSDETLIRAVLEAYPPALGTADIANKIGLSSEATRRHLKRLEESGYLSTDKLGSVRVWWVTDDGRAYLSGEDGSRTQ